MVLESGQMSNLKAIASNEEDLTSPSSDEKMDTGSESFRSQGTPNSVVSSDFDDSADQNVLRLQNPENYKLDPVNGLNESLIDRMSNLCIDTKPRNLGISPPKVSSELTLTTNHPLMGLESPEENYPDLIPKLSKNDEDFSFLSIEDDRLNCTQYYSPEKNTSKNNLYFSEHFVSADSYLLNDDLNVTPPDVARVETAKKKVVVDVFSEESPSKTEENCAINYKRNESSLSTPKTRSNNPLDKSKSLKLYSGVSERFEVPSQQNSVPNFDLPIEMSTNIALRNELESPDVVSSSTQGDRSAYQALLDPYTGNVALRPTTPRSSSLQRRVIMVPPDDDVCSLDSVSACSMESEDEPPEPECLEHYLPALDQQNLDEDEDKQSKSTMTVSDCSDPIPEYSATEELCDERAWLSVPRNGTHSVCDMKVIEPYKRVLSHGGYDSRGAALIVVSACHLPDNARPDYTYVMDNLFLYVIWTLERLVTDDYILVYLHGSADRRRLPTFRWLHECYKLIDRRLRKSLQHLYLVHPTFWLKSLVVICKPFVSSKFSRKLSYVRTLAELMEKVPVEPNAIPEIVKEYDALRR